MSMRILVVEDDPGIQTIVSKGLRQEGHTVEVASTGPEGKACIDANQYDALVLDIMLPEISGLELLRGLRASGRDTPVLILSAKGAVDDRVEGLTLGADDYMPKPFSFSELSARLAAITRRKQSVEAAGATELNLNGVKLDLIKHIAYRDGVKIDLQPREFSLLELLMRNPGKPVSKSFILERIWDCSFDPQTNIVDVLVCRLRGKVDGEHEEKLIRTMRGVGYVFGPGR